MLFLYVSLYASSYMGNKLYWFFSYPHIINCWKDKFFGLWYNSRAQDQRIANWIHSWMFHSLKSWKLQYILKSIYEAPQLFVNWARFSEFMNLSNIYEFYPEFIEMKESFSNLSSLFVFIIWVFSISAWVCFKYSSISWDILEFTQVFILPTRLFGTWQYFLEV